MRDIREAVKKWLTAEIELSELKSQSEALNRRYANAVAEQKTRADQLIKEGVGANIPRKTFVIDQHVVILTTEGISKDRYE
jgi:hypothetical protein